MHLNQHPALKTYSRSTVPLRFAPFLSTLAQCSHSSLTLCQHKLLLVLTFCMLSTAALAQQALYLERTEQAVPTAKQLEDSEKLVNEHEDVKIIERTRIQPFHKQPKYQEFSDQSFCTNCHLAIPHRKNLRARTFLNMHTSFIACETCHFRPEDISLDYRWFNFDSKQLAAQDTQLFKVVKPQTPEEMRRFTKRDTAIKITPYYGQQAAIIFHDNATMQNELNTWKNGSFDDKVRTRAKIHAVLENKGPDCDACHQQDEPLLNFQALGATPKQIKAIAEHRIPQFFSNYTEDDQRIRMLEVLE